MKNLLIYNYDRDEQQLFWNGPNLFFDFFGKNTNNYERYKNNNTIFYILVDDTTESLSR